MAVTDIKKTVGEAEQIVVFKLNNELYGLKVGQIESIERLSRITRVPRTREHILGVINLRGEIIPLISLSKIIGTESIEHTDASRMIILQLHDYKLGFIADGVTEIAFIDENMLQSNQQLFNGDKQWINGVYRLKDSYVMLLDIDTLLNRGGV